MTLLFFKLQTFSIIFIKYALNYRKYFYWDLTSIHLFSALFCERAFSKSILTAKTYIEFSQCFSGLKNSIRIDCGLTVGKSCL